MFIHFSLQREINEVLEQRKLIEAAAPQSLHDQNGMVRSKETHQMYHPNGRVQSQNGIDFANHDSLRAAHCQLNSKIIRNAASLNAAAIASSKQHGSNIRKTNEWADSILKDLDNLILSNQRYTASLSNSIASNATAASAASAAATGSPKTSHQKRSTIINVVLRKTTPSTSPTSPTAPTAFASTPANLNKNQTAIITAPAKDNNKIPKPEIFQHVSGFDFSFFIYFFFIIRSYASHFLFFSNEFFFRYFL